MFKIIEIFLKRRSASTVFSLAARAEKEQLKRVLPGIPKSARVRFADLSAARAHELSKLDQQTRAPLG